MFFETIFQKGGEAFLATRRSPRGLAEKPRVLVVEREPNAARPRLEDDYDVVVAHGVAGDLVLLRAGEFAGVYVNAAQLPALRWIGSILQADEILDAIADGVALVDPQIQILWVNPEFRRISDPLLENISGVNFYRARRTRNPRTRPLSVHNRLGIENIGRDRHSGQRQSLPQNHRHPGLRSSSARLFT